MKEKYRFKITVESLDSVEEGKAPKPPLVFEVSNHDNILAIVKRLRTGLAFGTDTSTSFAVGLKLLTEVILEHRNDPLFLELKPAIVQFMKRLKAQLRDSSAATSLSATRVAADTCVDLNGPVSQVTEAAPRSVQQHDVAPQKQASTNEAKDILNEVLNEVLNETASSGKAFFQQELMHARSEAEKEQSQSSSSSQ